MKTLVTLTGMGILTGSLALAAPGEAVTRCVSPTVVSCFSTIQAAVNASFAGDEVVVFDGTYKEEVVVSTPNLKIRGNAPGVLKPITAFPEFAGLAADLQKLALAGNRFLGTCPKAVIEICETANTLGTCGDDNVTHGVTIMAPGVTVQDLTIRHAYNAIDIVLGADNTTVKGVCFQSDQKGVNTGGSADGTRLDYVNMSGGGNTSLFLDGDNCKIEHSIAFDSGFWTIVGDNNSLYQNAAFNGAGLNAVSFGSGGGRFTGNVALGVSLSLNGPNMDVGWNLLSLSPASLLMSDSMIHHNIASNVSLIGSDNQISDNLTRRGGLQLQGSRNQVRRNTFTESSYVGGLVMSGDDNVFTDNLATFNARAGIWFQNGMGNTADRNRLADNLGEGFANGAGATDSVVTNNVSTRNRGVCNDGTIATFTGNLVSDGSGPATPCVVQQ